MPTQTQQVLDLAQSYGVIRARDLKERGLSPRYLSRLAERGDLDRVGRGLYRHPDAPLSEHHSLALVAARYPDATACLLSALQVWDLTTQWPRCVWAARETGDWVPEASPAELEVVHMSGPAWTEGKETVSIENVPVSVFGPAKTVADCFRFRGRVGLDVAIEALKDYVRQQAGPIDDLYRFAEVCRVRSVMAPYIEAVAHRG
jgi:predicted transcriptional regulator of viral defense system